MRERDVHMLRARALFAVRSAALEIRLACTDAARDDPSGALGLAQIVGGLNATIAGSAHEPVQTPKGEHDADILIIVRHWTAVVDMADKVAGLWEAALQARRVVPVPAALRFTSTDDAMFGVTPMAEVSLSFQVWVAATDLARLQQVVPRGRLADADHPDFTAAEAEVRRDAILGAADAWGSAYHRAHVTSGLGPLDECAAELQTVKADLQAAILDTPASTHDGLEAKARTAARLLVEFTDDPEDLAGVVRDYTGVRDYGAGPDGIAWSVVTDLLGVSDRA